MKIQLVFDVAGQGLFYHGEVGNLRFVYDCGSSSQGRKFKRAISNVKAQLKDRNLELLIISHFHSDHVSGLDRLLRGLRVGYAIIPYISPLERLLIAAKNLHQQDWYYDFLSDPVLFLLDRGVHTVVVIGPGENDLRDDDDTGADSPSLDGGEYPDEIRVSLESFHMNDDQDILKKIEKQDPQWVQRRDQGRLLVKNHRGLLNLSGFWIFRFFNLKANDEQLAQFANCLEGYNLPLESFAASSLCGLFKNKKSLRELARCYKSIQIDINNTSLLTFHGSLRPMNSLNYRFQGAFWFGSWNLPSGLVGYLLTGDFNLKHPNWKQAEKHFENYFVRMTGVLIPHHGSSKSWNPLLIERLQKERTRSNWFVSAGIGNRYGHPSPKVLQKIMNEGQGILWSNDFYDVSEEFHTK